MEGLKVIPFLAIVLTIAGVIIGASAISLAKFGDSVTNQCYNGSYTYNSTLRACENSSPVGGASVGKGSTNLSIEMYAITNGLEGEETIAEQLPTVAIISVMVIIISIIAGVFVYLRYFG